MTDVAPILLFIDSIIVLLLGLKDLKETEFEAYYLPLSLILPAIIYYLNIHDVLFVIFAISIVVGTGILIWKGLMGYMDIAVIVRMPFMYLLGVDGTVGITAGFILGIIFFHIKYIKPLLCEPYNPFLFFVPVARVKRELFMLPYVYPQGVKVEDENVDKIKRKMLESTQDKCIDAIVATPFIFVFSIGYILGVIVYLLGLYF